MYCGTDFVLIIKVQGVKTINNSAFFSAWIPKCYTVDKVAEIFTILTPLLRSPEVFVFGGRTYCATLMETSGDVEFSLCVTGTAANSDQGSHTSKKGKHLVADYSFKPILTA